MKHIGEVFVRYCYLLILLNLFLLIICLIFKRFGLAEDLGNFFVGLSIVVFTWQLLKSKFSNTNKTRSIYSVRFLSIGWGLIILAAILVFKALLLDGPAVWGDAPHYFPESFREFPVEPGSWDSRGSLGIVNDLYWIYPLMLIYHWLGYLGFGNEIIIRILFYFPAIFFALLSPWLYSRYLGFSTLVSLYSAAVYSLNSYFILVIDGGQIGVALAYGLFPLTLMYLHKLIINKTAQQFLKSLATVMLLIIADLRLAAIAVLAFLIWVGFENTNYMKKLRHFNFKILGLFILAILTLSAYWIIPAIKLQSTTGAGLRPEAQLITVLNPLFLYAPHWPLNEYGKISPPEWIYIGIPLAIFSNLLFKKSRRVIALFLNFLLFVFLAKGDNGLLGEFYGWVVDSIPFAGAFRDSTKFFAPVLLLGGILFGLSVENFLNLFKRQLFSKILAIIVLIYLLVLIYPALVGSMHGVLVGRQLSRDIEIIARNISSEDNFVRTAWFPERHPLAFSIENKPALDAKGLVSLRPLASLNTGTYDSFNFLHNRESLEWFKLLGIKYLVLSGNQRIVVPTEEDKKNWDSLLNLTSTTSGLLKENWDIDIPVYRIDNTLPRIFASEKLIVTIGGDEIYQELPPTKAAFIFIEDGRFNPSSLQKVASDSAVLLFNNKSKTDLQMSFLQKYFVDPKKNISSDWANRTSGEYLKWRYELLTNGVRTREFDYGKGVSFSTVKGEKIVISAVPGEYYLAIRYLSPSGNLNSKIAGYEKILPQTNSFRWFISELLQITPKENLVLENNGFNVVNVVAFIPKREFSEAALQTKDMVEKFDNYNFELDKNSLTKILRENKMQPVQYETVSPYKYKVSQNIYPWVIFTDSYNQLWKASGELPVPMYSIINGFYLPSGTSFEILFTGQDIVNRGVRISAISLAILVLTIVAIGSRKRLW